jgi:hypothetical protein
VKGHNVSHARPELTHQEMQNCVCLNVPDSSDNSVLCASRSYTVSSAFNDDWFTVNSLRSRHAHDDGGLYSALTLKLLQRYEF